MIIKDANKMMESRLPFITIAIPVRNEERFICDTLNELLRQDYPKDRFEIIVADGESTDSTREIVQEIAHSHQQVMLMSNPGLIPSSGRNVGFKNGKGDIFLVIDGHCQIKNNNLLKDVAECFERSGAQCLGRPQPFIVPKELNMQRAIALARASWLGHSTDSFIHSNKEGFVSPVSVGCAYKREVFKKNGFVDESFDACEDVEFNYRVEKSGFKAFFSPKIAVHYYPREKLTGLWHQLIRYGEGRTRFMFKHPETINLNMFLPVVFSCGIFLGPILGLISKYFLLTYVSILFSYFTMVSIESIRLSAGNGMIFALKIIVVFSLIHLSLGIGLIKGFYKIFTRLCLK